MSTPAQLALQQAQLYTDEQDYLLLRLPTRAVMAAAGVIAEIAEPFCTLIHDKDELSLILPSAAWEDFANRLPGAQAAPTPYRLITFDLPLDLNLIGFMALVSSALAAAEISILPIAAFSRDHLLIPAAQINQALHALHQLQASIK